MHKIPKELRLTCSHECGYKLKFTQPPCNVTANKGNIISLKQLIQHEFKCDDTYIAACHDNQLEIIKYLYILFYLEQEYPWNSDLCTVAAAYGSTKILQYALKKDVLQIIERIYLRNIITNPKLWNI